MADVRGNRRRLALKAAGVLRKQRSPTTNGQLPAPWQSRASRPRQSRPNPDRRQSAMSTLRMVILLPSSCCVAAVHAEVDASFFVAGIEVHG